MHITHSRAVAAAVLALSTCAGASTLAERTPRAPERTPARVALDVRQTPAADTATIAREAPSAAQ